MIFVDLNSLLTGFLGGKEINVEETDDSEHFTEIDSDFEI